jgi:hypothetical protein
MPLQNCRYHHIAIASYSTLFRKFEKIKSEKHFSRQKALTKETL